MRGAIKALAGAVVLSAGGLVFAASVFLARPGALVSSRTVGAALKYFGADWSPRWETLSVSSAVLGPRRHRYVLGATGFCVDDRRGVFTGCFSSIDLSVVVFYSRRGPVIEKIERLVALAKTARFDLRGRQPRGAVRGLPLGLPEALRAAPIRVEAARFSIASSSTAVSGSFRAAYAPGKRRPLTVAADLLIGGGADARRLKGELTADSDFLKGGARPTSRSTGAWTWDRTAACGPHSAPGARLSVTRFREAPTSSSRRALCGCFASPLAGARLRCPPACASLPRPR